MRYNPFWYLYYCFAYRLLYTLARILFNFRIIHPEKAFRHGGVIFAPNHASFLDPPLVGLAARRPLIYMAKRELLKGFYGLVMSSLGAHPVDREGADIAAFRYALSVLKSGEAMVIFPEGTRTPDGQLQSGQPGIARIARRANVPIVPVYIHGTFEALSRHMKKVNRSPVTIIIGDPITVEEQFIFPDDKEGYQACADEIMRRIAVLAKELQ